MPTSHPVPLEMFQVLAHGDSLLDQGVQILRDLGGQARALQDTQDLGASDGGDTGDGVLITQQDTDGRGGHTLTGKLVDHVLDLGWERVGRVGWEGWDGVWRDEMGDGVLVVQRERERVG